MLNEWRLSNEIVRSSHNVPKPAKPDSCIGCPAYDAPGPVWGEFNPNPRAIVVGEAPGDQEVDTGVPFKGPAGGLLWRMAAQVSLRRHECYILNVACCITKDPAAFRFCWKTYG